MYKDEAYIKLRSMGYNPEGLKLKEVIRFIQILEHNRPCFGYFPNNNRCLQWTCCFRETCMNVVPDIEWEVK